MIGVKYDKASGQIRCIIVPDSPLELQAIPPLHESEAWKVLDIQPEFTVENGFERINHHAVQLILDKELSK